MHWKVEQTSHHCLNGLVTYTLQNECIEIRDFLLPRHHQPPDSHLPDPFVLKVIVMLLALTLCLLAATSLTLFLAMILQV